MPSNDERREVAVRLRNTLLTEGASQYMMERDCDEPYAVAEVVFRNLRHLLGFNETYSVHAVANRLANLIEPEERTCRFAPENIHWYFDENDNEIVTEEGHPDGSDACNCSQCGYPMMAGEGGWFNESEGQHGGIVYEPRFNYCPNCGTRVTS